MTIKIKIWINFFFVFLFGVCALGFAKTCSHTTHRHNKIMHKQLVFGLDCIKNETYSSLSHTESGDRERQSQSDIEIMVVTLFLVVFRKYNLNGSHWAHGAMVAVVSGTPRRGEGGWVACHVSLSKIWPNIQYNFFLYFLISLDCVCVCVQNCLFFRWLAGWLVSRSVVEVGLLLFVRMGAPCGYNGCVLHILLWMPSAHLLLVSPLALLSRTTSPLPLFGFFFRFVSCCVFFFFIFINHVLVI